MTKLCTKLFFYQSDDTRFAVSACGLAYQSTFCANFSPLAPLKRVKRTDLRVAREHFVVLRCLSLFRIHLTLVEGAGVTQLMDTLVGPVDIVGTQTRMIPV